MNKYQHDVVADFDSTASKLRLTRCYNSHAFRILSNTIQTIRSFIQGKHAPDFPLVRHQYKKLIKKYKYSLEWRRYGKLHRDGDKPAVILAGGTQMWYKNGVKHRDGDKPAYLFLNGEITTVAKWYKNGGLHRSDGKPAHIRKFKDSGTKIYEWYVEGKRHRLDGPAVVPIDAMTRKTEYWLQGVKFDTVDEYISDPRISDSTAVELKLKLIKL